MAEPKRLLADVIKSEFSETATAVATPEAGGSDDMNRVWRYFEPTSVRRQRDYEATNPAPAAPAAKPEGVGGLSDDQLENLVWNARRELEKRNEDDDISDIVAGFEPVETEDDFTLDELDLDDEFEGGAYH